jgi:hypothetical protein
MLRFSIREWLLASTVVVVAVAWCVDHYRLQVAYREAAAMNAPLQETVEVLTGHLERQEGAEFGVFVNGKRLPVGKEVSAHQE